jgi:ankyrin repeat protein
MEDALERISGDLNEAFEETISRVKSLPKSKAQLGMDVLMWLCHAKRALSTAEVSDALAFWKGQGLKLDKYRPSTSMILECCHGLVVLGADTAYIELAHYSIQEYLESNTPSLFPSFEQKMASTCLGYLMLDDFKRGPEGIHDDDGSIDYDLIERRLVNYPFASYATHFWGKHNKHIQTTESSYSDLLDFVYDSGSIGSSVQIEHFKRGLRSIYVDPRECLSRTPMHHASSFGLERLLATILESPDASATVNHKTEVVGSTPIILAAASGHTKLVRLLLQHGADPYITNWYGNALHCAAEADQAETIVELVRSGMNLNYCDEYKKPGSRRSPISCTLDRDSVHALMALTKLGASVKVAENSGQQPFLHRAATRGASKIVEYLVRNNLADVHYKSRKGETALDCAIASRSTETIRTLLSVCAGSQQISSRSLVMLARLGFQLQSTILAERDEQDPADH